MRFSWEGREYLWDFSRITVSQAIVITNHTGQGLTSWQTACEQMDPKSLQALLWAVKAQNGEKCEIGSLDFPMMQFVEAFGAGVDDAPLAADPTVEAPQPPASSTSPI